MTFAALVAVIRVTTFAQTERDSYRDQAPLAMVDVQPLSEPPNESYDYRNAVMRYRPEQEDPLSFYTRTQDGEWRIPAQVNPDDPWVRLLMLGPGKPTIIDVAVEINQQPFRAAREDWIDKLLAEAKATFLVRTGAATAEAAGITETAEEAADEKDSASNHSGSKGTSAAVAASEASSNDSADNDAAKNDAADNDSADNNAAEEEVPMVAVQSRQTGTLFKRLINYLAADQSSAEREASREELRWLLAEWTGGPALLTLSPAFAWKRADVAPLWYALDRDGNQVLSSEEIQQSTKTLQQADINRDDIVSLDELQRMRKDHATHEGIKGHPLVVVIDENTDWKALKKHLRIAYPAQQAAGGGMSLVDRLGQGDRSIRVADLANLLSLPADVMVRVLFANKAAQVALLAVSDDSNDRWRLDSSSEDVITIGQRTMYLELSAAQGEIDEENIGGDMQQTQVAIGGVVDGYPCFRLLDHDNNRQLTQRELRNIADFLSSFDENQDGQIERYEIPTAIRLAVTHGPQVHQYLSRAVAAQREYDDQPKSEAPAWFAGMDRNKDGDLSKREFQGSPAQFTKYDRDSDGFISPLEAQKN